MTNAANPINTKKRTGLNPLTMARARQSYAIVAGNLLSLCSIEHVKSLDLTPNFPPEVVEVAAFERIFLSRLRGRLHSFLNA